mmetsp:Transcript_16383/g.47198  ORF Transcript_16383/g.47198 Transcript_16383/m.47198 type:complete len:439 (-) Transcript_16383:2155-3471(-)
MPAANIAPMDSQAKPHASSEPLTYWGRVRDVAAAFFPMGFIAFGGPAAHIGLFLKTFVEGERPWLDEQRFMELMSLGQAMPGPTSTQMATAMGITRAGALGGLVSFWLFDWVGFAVQLSTGAAVYYLDLGALDTYKMVVLGAGPAAISLVFLAARMLGNKACGDDPLRISLALFTCFVALLLPREHMRWAAFAFPGLILFGGLVTALDARRPSRRAAYEKALSPPTGKGLLKQIGIPRPAGLLLAMVAVGLFPFAWVARDLACGGFGGAGSRQLAVFSSLYWMGFSIYGGGQVVLPMLESEFTRGRCEPGETGSFPPLDAETFGFGLALAQSLPGPLFNLSAFLGAAVAGVGGGIVGFLGLFGPGILLIYALMPFWEARAAPASAPPSGPASAGPLAPLPARVSPRGPSLRTTRLTESPSRSAMSPPAPPLAPVAATA